MFIPVITVDSCGERTECEATSIRRSADKPLGTYRWLVWAASPAMGEIGGQNTTFEEMQVIPAKGDAKRSITSDRGRNGALLPHPSLRTGQADFPHPARQSMSARMSGLRLSLLGTRG